MLGALSRRRRPRSNSTRGLRPLPGARALAARVGRRAAVVGRAVEPPPALRERLLETVSSEAGDAARLAEAGRPSLRPWRSRGGSAPCRCGRRPRSPRSLLLLAARSRGLRDSNGGDGSGTTTIAAAGTSPQARRSSAAATPASCASPTCRSGGAASTRSGSSRTASRCPRGSSRCDRDGTGAAGDPDGLDRATQVMVTSEPPGRQREADHPAGPERADLEAGPHDHLRPVRIYMSGDGRTRAREPDLA